MDIFSKEYSNNFITRDKLIKTPTSFNQSIHSKKLDVRYNNSMSTGSTKLSCLNIKRNNYLKFCPHQLALGWQYIQII